MKLEWSQDWKASKRPNKQRKYRFNAPLHIQQNFLGVHLSPELRKKYGRRSFTVRKGDKIKILRGQYKKKTGKVNKVLIKSQKIYVDGIDHVKKDGNTVFVPMHPTNLMIMELELTDKKRKARLEKKTGKENK